MVVLDHNMVFRYYGNSIYQVYNTVEEILSEGSWVEGDFNNDSMTDVFDIIMIVNSILNDNYSYQQDLNDDLTVNIIDIILLVEIIIYN